MAHSAEEMIHIGGTNLKIDVRAHFAFLEELSVLRPLESTPYNRLSFDTLKPHQDDPKVWNSNRYIVLHCGRYMRQRAIRRLIQAATKKYQTIRVIVVKKF